MNSIINAWQRLKRKRNQLAAEAANRRQIDTISAWLEQNEQGKPVGQPVVFFNASTRLAGLSLNAAFSLVAGWAVRLSGAPVIHFVCQSGMSRCVLGTDRENPDQPPPCAACRSISRQVYANSNRFDFEFSTEQEWAEKLNRMRLPELMQAEADGLPLGEIVLPSLRWILRRHTLLDDAVTRKLYVEYLLSARNIAQKFTQLLDEQNPRAVVIFNGMFYPEAVVKTLARKRGIPAISHEVGLRPFTAFFTTGEATAYPIDIPEEFKLSDEQNARLDDYLVQRFKGNFSMAGIQFWPEMRRLPSEFWERAGRYKQIVPVFTNVIFDTSQGHANVVFEQMFDWLDKTLEIIQGHPETLFVIRAHPDESRPGKASQESVAGWAASRNLDQVPNVLFVGADEYLSSYELIRHSKFVMVYNSTIGLEASLLGAVVLCAGKARYTQLSTVFFPPTIEDFQSTAEMFLNLDAVKPPVEMKMNARRFLYYQLYRTAVPFNDFLEDGGYWQGYVKLKRFSPQALLPENSPALKTVVNGILSGAPFLMDE